MTHIIIGIFTGGFLSAFIMAILFSKYAEKIDTIVSELKSLKVELELMRVFDKKD